MNTLADDIRRIETCSFLLGDIRKRLEAKDWNPNDRTQEDTFVVTISEDYPYIFDSVKLIEKHMSKDGWQFKMYKYKVEDHFSVALDKTVKWHTYTWHYKRV